MSIENIHDIKFDGEFEEETDVCIVCGDDAELTGWNEEKDLSRFECDNCGAVYVYDNSYNPTFIRGEKRDWYKFLSQELSFPLDGFVAEAQGNPFEETNPIRYGDKVIVKKLIIEDDLYGVIAEIKSKGKTYHFPLCDIGIENEKSPNFKILDNYRTWFANCR